MEIQFLGDAIMARRIDLGLTQEELCEGICEPVTLSRLENGRHIPSHNRVKAILQRLNMPDERYYALLSQQELELANARKELLSHANRFARAGADQKRRAWELAMEQLHRLEELAEEDDAITRQFILSCKATLGTADGPYTSERRLDLLLQALRLTVPRFDPEKIGTRRYSVDETQLMNQIARTYSDAGDHPRALGIYRQLYDHVRKYSDRLSNFPAHFTLIAYNYAQELGLCKYYHEALEVAEAGRQASVNYGYYRFFPGFLSILAETYYRLGEEEKSKKLWFQAHYLYEALGDERNLRIIDPDIKARFHVEFQA